MQYTHILQYIGAAVSCLRDFPACVIGRKFLSRRFPRNFRFSASCGNRTDAVHCVHVQVLSMDCVSAKSRITFWSCYSDNKIIKCFLTGGIFRQLFSTFALCSTILMDECQKHKNNLKAQGKRTLTGLFSQMYSTSPFKN